MKRKIICIIMMCVLSMSCLSACGGGSDSSDSSSESQTDDTLATYMTITQNAIGNFLDDVDYSYNSDDWTYIEDDDDGSTLLTTEITTKDSSEKQVVTCIFTLDGDDYSVHYLKVGGTEYIDDGTQE